MPPPRRYFARSTACDVLAGVIAVVSIGCAPSFFTGDRSSQLDWPQLGGSPRRSHVAAGVEVPADWNLETGRNVRWSFPLGPGTAAAPTVAGGRVFIGSRSGSDLPQARESGDSGCLLCLDEESGELLWQHKTPSLTDASPRLLGMGGSPAVDGERLYVITHRAEVCCLDVLGFHDGENDGPYQQEERGGANDADIVWLVDLAEWLEVVPDRADQTSVAVVEGVVLANTHHALRNVDGSSEEKAPSFIALDKRTGQLLWTHTLAGTPVTDQQLASPAFSSGGQRDQAIFAGADGWIYSFELQADSQQDAEPLWQFDCGPKLTDWILGTLTSNIENPHQSRNLVLATPTVSNGRVYVVGMQKTRADQGHGIVWCVDASHNGDVSPTLAATMSGKSVPLSRVLAVPHDAGEREMENANSAAVWSYTEFGESYDGRLERPIASAAVDGTFLFIADVMGAAHCLDAKTGLWWWTHELTAPTYSTPLVADGKVYFADESGTVTVLALARQKQLLAQHQLGDAIYSSPVAANHTLFLTRQDRLFAMQESAGE